MHRRTFILAGTTTALTVIDATAAPAKSAFVVGQVWTVRAAPPTSTKVVIGRVEDYRGRTAVHVSLIDVPVPPGLVIRPPTTALPHLPFDGDALAGSVDMIVASGAPPAEHFEGGYAQWKAAKGGIFTITVPQAIEVVFRTIPRAAP